MTHSTIASCERVVTVVIGMHRSGTSLCSNILSLLGLDMADEVTRNEGNPRGHWERWEIVGFHDRILQLLGREYYTHRHAEMLPDGWWAEPAIRGIRDEMIAWIRNRMGDSQLFGFKDPRTARFLPLWDEVFRKTGWVPRFVFCIRDPDQSMRSFIDRDGEHLSYLDPEYRWLIYNAAGVRGIGDAPVCIIPYEGWFSDLDGNVGRLHRFITGGEVRLGADVRRAVAAATDEGLRHDRRVSIRAGLGTRSLYRAVLASVPHGRFSQRALDIANQVGEFEPLMSSLHDRSVAAWELETTLAGQVQEHAAIRDALERELQEERGRTAGLAEQVAEFETRTRDLEQQLEEVRAKLRQMEHAHV